MEQGLSGRGGDDHIIAQELIMGWIREQQTLAPEDRELLLTHLSREQPPDMSSGEWAERVNELLNLLRAQPGGVPGLADLLLQMAEYDPNPVLRMYALQHISFLIPEEPSAEKRQAMVNYLHTLADTPGDSLAGSAVLFLSDLKKSGDWEEGDIRSQML